MKKKILLMTLMLLSAAAQGAWADTWDGVTYTEPTYYSSRSVSNPAFFQGEQQFTNAVFITSAAELAYINSHFTETVTLSGNTKKWSEFDYVLTTDIDMGDAKSWNSMGNDNNNPTAFTGKFYGVYHTIRIHIQGATTNYQGLFAKIGKNGKVVNLHVDGIVQCSSSRLVGGITGENVGEIEDCWVSADVSSSWKNSSSAYAAKVGGLAGDNFGTIKYCCMTGNVTNNDASVGGLVGSDNSFRLDEEQGKLEHCTFYGTRYSDHKQDNIFVGDCTGDVVDCHSGFTAEELYDHFSSIDSQYKFYRRVLLEPYSITINNETEGALTSSYEKFPGQTITLTPKDGNNIVHIKVKDADGNLIAEWYTPFDAQLTFTMPKRNVIVTTTNAPWEGKGTEEDPYLISTPGEWEQIHKQMMEANPDDVFSGTCFKQTADIDITQGIGSTGESNSKSFCGTYDGDGHRLNCSLENPVSGSPEAVAPFHKVKNATIKNLYVTGTISGGIHTAGLVAYTEGTVNINNCRVAADISCTGNSSNNAHGGGFVGHAQESDITVTDCLFDGSIKASANDGDGTRLGAIIGFSGKTTKVSNCVENATFTTAAGQTAFCWKDQGSAEIGKDSGGNCYLSDLSQVSGAYKLYSVTSGTEGLELAFPDECYEWKEAYHRALFMSLTDYAYAYLIGGQFYTIKSSSIQFDATYPEDWIVSLYYGETQLPYKSGHYGFKLERDEDVVITAEYKIVNWIDEGNYATEFSDVDETNKVVTITTPEELARLSRLLYNGEERGTGWTYKLGADLDMSGHAWTPIGKITGEEETNVAFEGTFDGQGHTISGINVTTHSEFFGGVGLFCYVDNEATVQNVKLVNSSFEGYHYVGGIAGVEAISTIRNCYVGNDVTLKAQAQQADCGGIVGVAGGDYGIIEGCYSAAKLSPANDEASNVGGIVGYVLRENIIRKNVSQAVIDRGTNENRGYIFGAKEDEATSSDNYYIAEETSSHPDDERAFLVSADSGLKETGYSLTCDDEADDYDCSGITFHMGENYSQFQTGNEWYGGENKEFHFNLTNTIEGVNLEDVTVNGSNADEADGCYCFTVTTEATVSGKPLLRLSDSKDNSSMLEAFEGKTVNVMLDGRTLYKDANQIKAGSWNTICLPFDLTLSESVLKGATARTLANTNFRNSTLTLSFGSNASTLSAGMPYIIRWADEGDNIENPKFTDVTISSKAENTTTLSHVDFVGSFSPVSLAANDRTVLYMGAENKLYYPNAAMTVGACRAYFKLKDGLTAGDLTSDEVKAIRLDFNDGEATGIQTTNFANDTNGNDSWFTIDGRQLSGQPAQPGIYIHNGQKVMMK